MTPNLLYVAYKIYILNPLFSHLANIFEHHVLDRAPKYMIVNETNTVPCSHGLYIIMGKVGEKKKPKVNKQETNCLP